MNFLRDIFTLLGNLLKWYFIVVPWEQVVRVRLGKHLRLYDAGFHFKIPYVDKLYRQSTRQRWTALEEQTLTCPDMTSGKVITLQGMLGYSIVNIELLLQTLHHPEATLKGEAMRIISRYIHTHNLEECKPANLEDFVQKALNLEKYGIGNTELSITDFAVVKTYRLLTSEGSRYLPGDSLSTTAEDDETGY